MASLAVESGLGAQTAGKGLFTAVLAEGGISSSLLGSCPPPSLALLAM